MSILPSGDTIKGEPSRLGHDVGSELDNLKRLSFALKYNVIQSTS